MEPFRALPDSAPPHILVDCTFGGGGHTRAFLEAFASESKLSKHKVVGLDQDPGAIARGNQNFDAQIRAGQLELRHLHFKDADQVLNSAPCLGLLADLGFSSDQIQDGERGLSFQSDGPLDMRLDPTQGISARDHLARMNERELEKVLSEYGEENFSRRIAQAILRTKSEEKGLPRTTRELAEVISKAVPPNARYGRLHPATRTFQALRILVNNELNELDCLLERVILLLKPRGRVAILSFHSLEDRKVKQILKPAVSSRHLDQAPFRALTKKPLQAEEAEVLRNPRSRSAKLRIAERTDS